MCVTSIHDGEKGVKPEELEAAGLTYVTKRPIPTTWDPEAKVTNIHYYLTKKGMEGKDIPKLKLKLVDGWMHLQQHKTSHTTLTLHACTPARRSSLLALVTHCSVDRARFDCIIPIFANTDTSQMYLIDSERLATASAAERYAKMVEEVYNEIMKDIPADQI